jgi:hypothetical protein
MNTQSPTLVCVADKNFDKLKIETRNTNVVVASTSCGKLISAKAAFRMSVGSQSRLSQAEEFASGQRRFREQRRAKFAKRNFCSAYHATSNLNDKKVQLLSMNSPRRGALRDTCGGSNSLNQTAKALRSRVPHRQTGV